MYTPFYGKIMLVLMTALAMVSAGPIAMAADEVYMSPVAMMMIHNPATIIFGEVSDLQSGIVMLSEVKESIINAYEQKTSLSRTKISHMMDAESWFNAWKAVELGFADKVLYTIEDHLTEPPSAAYIFDKMTVTNALVNKLPHKKPEPQLEPQPEPETPTPLIHLEKRLSLLRH